MNMILKKISFIVLIISLFSVNTKAQDGLRDKNINLSGTALSYAGDILEFKKFADPISKKEEAVGSCKVDAEGNFLFSFSIKKTNLTYINLEVYKGLLFLEPEKEYKIKFPKKRLKTEQDKLNPFFKQGEFIIGIANIDTLNLNYAVLRFDERLDNYLKNSFLKLIKADRKSVNEEIQKIEQEFSWCDNSYFRDYTYYKFAEIKHLSYERNKEFIIRKYLTDKKILYDNLAYFDFFNQLFDNCLLDFSKETQYRDIPKAILKDKSFKNLKKILSKNPIFKNPEFCELVILKGLHDAYFSRSFNSEVILVLLKQAEKQAVTDYHKEIAKNIIEKASQLMEGLPAPVFELKDKNGKIVSLKDFKGRFVYLNFVDIKSYACRKDMEVLKAFHEKSKKYFDIVTISFDENFNDLIQLAEKKSYNWTILHIGNQKNIKEIYDVNMFPSYYLIAPDGTLALSPAPPPDDDFRSQFNVLWKTNRVREMREKRGKH